MRVDKVDGIDRMNLSVDHLCCLVILLYMCLSCVSCRCNLVNLETMLPLHIWKVLMVRKGVAIIVLSSSAVACVACIWMGACSTRPSVSLAIERRWMWMTAMQRLLNGDLLGEDGTKIFVFAGSYDTFTNGDHPTLFHEITIML